MNTHNNYCRIFTSIVSGGEQFHAFLLKSFSVYPQSPPSTNITKNHLINKLLGNDNILFWSLPDPVPADLSSSNPPLPYFPYLSCSRNHILLTLPGYTRMFQISWLFLCLKHLFLLLSPCEVADTTQTVPSSKKSREHSVFSSVSYSVLCNCYNHLSVVTCLFLCLGIFTIYRGTWNRAASQETAC